MVILPGMRLFLFEWFCKGLSKGIYAEMANGLCIERTHLSIRMSELGLPSLHNIDKSAVWRAFERFMDGESFAESCAIEKIEHAELEALLRNCSTRVDKAIKKIRPKVNIRRIQSWSATFYK